MKLLAAAVVAVLSVVPVSELDRDPDSWSGREVTVAGEIIGDYSVRGDVVWFQLNDDPYSAVPLEERDGPAGGNVGIGVRIPRELWQPDWGGPGRYGVRGPIVEVTGTFLHNSPAEQGETFIDAHAASLVEAGRPIEQPSTSPGPAIVGVVLGAIGIVLYRFGRRPTYRRV
ncbi:MAG: hypothetical protein OEQ47_12400 [Acidimicrobiia bacterium]|nr:hypothetical protein [Acidimicrobiia bacterium]